MRNRGKVVIIEDSPDEGELLSDALADEAFVPVVCRSAAEGLASAADGRPVGVIIDWGLPDRPGVDVCRELRAKDPLMAIMFLSGRTDEATIARGLDAGADDFLAKPFRRTELIARFEAHVRKAAAAIPMVRAASASAPPAHSNLLRFGDIEVDLAAREVRVAGEPVGLGPLEFKLVEYLCQNAGVAISRDQIMSQVYGYEADISTERVDLLARRVRAKLGEGPARGGHLVAVPGYGYRWERRRRDDSPTTTLG
ncbi:MAG: response regulator transcription factor [Chloroflexi bacterium]|nr:MAG: response regulator transcription factor [Chloroflexota bacterium]